MKEAHIKIGKEWVKLIKVPISNVEQVGGNVIVTTKIDGVKRKVVYR